MRPAFFPALLFSIASLAGAADVSISGDIEAEMATYFDKEYSPTNAAHHEVNLTTGVNFDQGVSLELYMISFSTALLADSSRQRTIARNPDLIALAADGEARGPSIDFYGIAFMWDFTDNGTMVLGDLTYSAGNISFYRYRKTAVYGSILSEQYLRGVGLHAADGIVYLGFPDRNSKSLMGFASYAVPLIERTDEKLVIKPSGDLLLGGGGRHRRYTLGTEVLYNRARGILDYGVSAAWGTAPFHGSNWHSFLVEPSLSVGDFSLAGGLWFVQLANKNAPVSEQVDMPHQRFAYVEPGVTLHPRLGLGLSLEMHDPLVDVEKDETYFVSPNAYLYPAPGVEVNFWVGYGIKSSAPNATSTGITARAEF